MNKEFVKAYKDKFGANKPTSDPMEAAYVSVYLWKNTVEKAKSFDVKAIQDNAGGVTFDAPEGLVTIDGENHHITKTARIGEIRPDGLIYTIWESPDPIKPDPYLKSYPWAAGPVGAERRKSVDVLIGQLATGLSLGSILLLAALGLSLTFGQMGVINMAHGEFIMAGCYTAYVVQQVVSSAGVSLLISLVVGFLIGGCDGRPARNRP